ncbi:type I toxin-antitoxin system SymE family toxin [Paraburkholderia caribensis]|nr:type I toxin-antitoxin system SymE family toxin [Paraburkholderia caribensis]
MLARILLQQITDYLSKIPSVVSKTVTSTAVEPLHLRTEPPLYPWMKLAGRWIENAGFEAGQRVKIVVEHRRLIITAERKNKRPCMRPFAHFLPKKARSFCSTWTTCSHTGRFIGQYSTTIRPTRLASTVED